MGLSCMQTEELSHRSFQHEMARYSSNVGNKLQMMINVGKVCGFTSNFDTPKPFTTRKTVRGSLRAEFPRRSQIRGRATNSLWRRDWH